MLEEAGYRRDEWRHLTRWYALRVIQHPTDRKGNLRPLYRPDGVGPTTEEGRLLRRLADRKYPLWLADDWVREAAARKAEAGAGR